MYIYIPPCGLGDRGLDSSPGRVSNDKTFQLRAREKFVMHGNAPHTIPPVSGGRSVSLSRSASLFVSTAGMM